MMWALRMRAWSQDVIHGVRLRVVAYDRCPLWPWKSLSHQRDLYRGFIFRRTRGVQMFIVLVVVVVVAVIVSAFLKCPLQGPLAEIFRYPMLLFSKVCSEDSLQRFPNVRCSRCRLETERGTALGESIRRYRAWKKRVGGKGGVLCKRTYAYNRCPLWTWERFSSRGNLHREFMPWSP